MEDYCILRAAYGAICIGVFVYRNSPVFQAYVFGFGGNAVSSPTGYIMNAGYYTGFELSTFHYEVSFAVLALVHCAHGVISISRQMTEISLIRYFISAVLPSLYCLVCQSGIRSGCCLPYHFGLSVHSFIKIRKFL